MRKLKLVVLGALLAPALALGQVRAGISIDLPVVLPPMVVIQPGVQVVPECDHEVFYTNGWYWAREDGVWYRSRSHRGGWVMMPPRYVPAALVRVPPGHYRHWKEERREEREWRKAERRDEKAWRKAEKHREHDEDHDHGHGHGHGHDRD